MKKIYLLVTLLLFMFLIGCSKDKENPGQDAEGNKVVEKEKGSKEDVYPLTGVHTNESVDQRAVGVMVNNHPAARPQSGLSQADIVFEMLAEGGITRFLALFQSEQPEIVGPVRSAREYYFELAKGYEALYVYHGAANFVNDMINERGIEHLNGSIYDNDGHLFKRESFRKAPHNSYVLFDAVHDVAETKEYEMTSSVERLKFLDEDETIHGDPASQITVKYPVRNESDVVEFIYDQQTERYTRYESQEQTVELNSEEPIEVDNVFIVEASHEVFDNEGRRKINLEDGGKAYLFQKGKVEQLEWENADGKIIPVKDGKPVGFVVGQTWVNVVPSDPGIEQSVNISTE